MTLHRVRTPPRRAAPRRAQLTRGGRAQVTLVRAALLELTKKLDILQQGLQSDRNRGII
jgi:hypothetical protein